MSKEEKIANINASKSSQTIEKVNNLKSGINLSTYEVIRKELLVLKEMKTINEKQVPIFVRENEILNRIIHPNIAQIREIRLNDKKMPSILMERYLSNIDQAIKTKKLNKVDASFSIYQIAEGMKFIHSNGIINSNLKPSNILIGSDGLIKISDIGFNRLKATENNRIPLNDDIESLYFIAPEFLKNEDSDEKVDIYSFGLLSYFILSGGDLPKVSLVELVNMKPLQVPSSFTPNAKEIIEYCCSIDSQKRPSFIEIVDYLKNPDCILMDLSKSEHAEVQNRIKEHQKIIPPY